MQVRILDEKASNPSSGPHLLPEVTIHVLNHVKHSHIFLIDSFLLNHLIIVLAIATAFTLNGGSDPVWREGHLGVDGDWALKFKHPVRALQVVDAARNTLLHACLAPEVAH